MRNVQCTECTESVHSLITHQMRKLKIDSVFSIRVAEVNDRKMFELFSKYIRWKLGYIHTTSVRAAGQQQKNTILFIESGLVAKVHAKGRQRKRKTERDTQTNKHIGVARWLKSEKNGSREQIRCGWQEMNFTKMRFNFARNNWLKSHEINKCQSINSTHTHCHRCDAFNWYSCSGSSVEVAIIFEIEKVTICNPAAAAAELCRWGVIRANWLRLHYSFIRFINFRLS